MADLSPAGCAKEDTRTAWGRLQWTGEGRSMTSLGKSAPIPAEYLPLHKYLDGRYADTVVLTFSEIEDLIGITLPELARTDKTWWDNGGEGGTATSQSQSW